MYYKFKKKIEQTSVRIDEVSEDGAAAPLRERRLTFDFHPQVKNFIQLMLNSLNVYILHPWLLLKKK